MQWMEKFHTISTKKILGTKNPSRNIFSQMKKKITRFEKTTFDLTVRSYFDLKIPNQRQGLKS